MSAAEVRCRACKDWPITPCKVCGREIRRWYVPEEDCYKEFIIDSGRPLAFPDFDIERNAIGDEKKANVYDARTRESYGKVDV